VSSSKGKLINFKSGIGTTTKGEVYRQYKYSLIYWFNIAAPLTDCTKEQ